MDASILISVVFVLVVGSVIALFLNTFDNMYFGQKRKTMSRNRLGRTGPIRFPRRRA